jgi:hypothetical protein
VTSFAFFDRLISGSTKSERSQEVSRATGSFTGFGTVIHMFEDTVVSTYLLDFALAIASHLASLEHHGSPMFASIENPLHAHDARRWLTPFEKVD